MGRGLGSFQRTVLGLLPRTRESDTVAINRYYPGARGSIEAGSGGVTAYGFDVTPVDGVYDLRALTRLLALGRHETLVVDSGNQIAIGHAASEVNHAVKGLLRR